MTSLHPEQLFHVGVTATDLDTAKAQMSRDLGVAWKGGRPMVFDLCLDGVDRQVEMRIAHTVQGPPHLELIQCVPDTPWAEPSVGTHHLCYWSEDAAGACAALEAQGARRVLGKPGSAGGYFRLQSGLLVEIIDPALRDRLTAVIRSERAGSGAAP